MGPIEIVFLLLVAVFIVIGIVRGYARELGVTTMLLIALFVLEFLSELRVLPPSCASCPCGIAANVTTGGRCPLVSHRHPREARLYAGVGVVRDSDPAAELAETEVKLGALLPVLSG